MNKNKAEEQRVLEIILSSSSGRIEAEWNDKGDPKGLQDSYTIDQREVGNKADDCRRALAELESADWSEGNPLELGPKLQTLAECGMLLYEAIFTGSLRAAGSRETAEKSKSWFEENVLSNPDAWRIQVVHKNYDAPILPWSLIFSPLTDGRNLDDLTDKLEDYENFWSLRHNLTVRGILRDDAEKIPGKVPGQDSKIHISLEFGDDAVAEHKERIKQKANAFVDEDVADSIEKLEDIDQRDRHFNIFKYSFLMAEGSQFQFGDDVFTGADIADTSERAKEVFILFLDGGCVTGTDGGASWLNTTLKMGRSGLIAAETAIENPDLYTCGWDFMKATLMSKDPLVKSIAAARRVLFPRSLFYGVYCDPLHMFFEPPPGERIEDADDFIQTMRERHKRSRG